jgi:hypothetical protein
MAAGRFTAARQAKLAIRPLLCHAVVCQDTVQAPKAFMALCNPLLPGPSSPPLIVYNMPLSIASFKQSGSVPWGAHAPQSKRRTSSTAAVSFMGPLCSVSFPPRFTASTCSKAGGRSQGPNRWLLVNAHHFMPTIARQLLDNLAVSESPSLRAEEM